MRYEADASPPASAVPGKRDRRRAGRGRTRAGSRASRHRLARRSTGLQATRRSSVRVVYGCCGISDPSGFGVVLETVRQPRAEVVYLPICQPGPAALDFPGDDGAGRFDTPCPTGAPPRTHRRVGAGRPPAERARPEPPLGRRPDDRRHATDALVAEGLVKRRQGSGTFVLPRTPLRFLGLTSFTQDMHERGLVPASRLVAFGVSPADPGLASRLGRRRRRASGRLHAGAPRQRRADGRRIGVDPRVPRAGDGAR